MSQIASKRPKIQAGKDVELTQDEDVLDTWFSSASMAFFNPWMA